MAIPKYDELYPDFLTALISGAPRASRATSARRSPSGVN